MGPRLFDWMAVYVDGVALGVDGLAGKPDNAFDEVWDVVVARYGDGGAGGEDDDVAAVNGAKVYAEFGDNDAVAYLQCWFHGA